MIRISGEQAKKLRELGVRDGENGIYVTKAHHKSWYLCTSPRNMKLLNQISK